MTSTYAKKIDESDLVRPATSSPLVPAAKPPQANQKFSDSRRSFTVNLLALLICIYAALWLAYPWRPLAELDVPGWIVDFADQVDLMMTTRNPPVVILGSSLTLAAPRRLRKPDVYQEEISNKSGRHLDVSVMAVPGAIASDQDFILEELLSHHKKPSLLVYTYAARDFMDNTIEGKISSTPTRRVLTFINRRSSFLPANLSPGAISQCFDNHAAFLDLVRRHVLRCARSWACNLSGHPDTLWAAAHQQSDTTAADKKGEGAQKDGYLKESASNGRNNKDSANRVDADEAPQVRHKALLEDLALYGRRYNPLNEKRATEQYEHLENLLRLARQNGIRVELLGMPLSPANLNLLKPGVYNDMKKRLTALATEYGATIDDLNTDKEGRPGQSSAFTQDDYLDSVHLSTPGARKFVPIFTDIVVGSSAFKAAFADKQKQ
ncbi:MAG: DUF1574 domain-containing protein [Cyanobacteria bacterium REEB67]|nr:DUF1574 domain-containing protein [Cyanobacteria bacterium REEB67]